MARRAARYWDAGPFIAWLVPEAWRADKCEPVIREAEAGRLLIVTSSVSLIEVVRLDKKAAPISIPDPKAQAIISAFFKQSYISVRDVDPRTAELARGLIWDHGLQTRDAIHLATAIRSGVTQVDSFDSDMLALNGRIGRPPITIAEPNLPFQMTLKLPEDETAEPATDAAREEGEADG